MVGFVTARSTYYVDQINKVITGGIFGDKRYGYSQLQAIVGYNAVIVLLNGQVIRTGIVKKYI